MIRRGVVAAALRLGLALAVYALAAVAFRAARPTGTPPLLGIVLITVAVAALLWWSGDAIDRVARRIAFGGRAEGVAALDGVLRRLADSLPVEDVVPRLAQAIGRDRKRAEVQVWLADGSRLRHVWPPEAADDGAAPLHVDVVHGGAAIGELGVDLGRTDVTSFDRRLLDELASAAGVAMSTVRLTVDLQRRQGQLMEINQHIAESTERLRAARVEQQRRMRGELAAAVLPHVDAAVTACDSGDGARARQEAQAALDALRRISRGIHPPRLAEDGVAASVRGWLDTTGRRTALDAVGDSDRLGPDLAAAVYFIAVTLIDALDATAVRLSIGDTVELAVIGPGLRDADGLTLARDRVEAFAGQVETPSPGAVTCRLAVDPPEQVLVP